MILLFGIYGACTRSELANLYSDNIKDIGEFILVIMQDTNGKLKRQFLITDHDTLFKGCDLYRKYAKLRPSNLENGRFLLNYKNGICSRLVVGHNRIGGTPRKIAEFLNLNNPEKYTGHCFRRSSALIFGEKGVVLLN